MMICCCVQVVVMAPSSCGMLWSSTAHTIWKDHLALYSKYWKIFQNWICFEIVSQFVKLAQLVDMPSIRAVTSLFQFGGVSSRHQQTAALLFLCGLWDPDLGPADQQVYLCFGEPLQCRHIAGLLSWWPNSN